MGDSVGFWNNMQSLFHLLKVHDYQRKKIINIYLVHLGYRLLSVGVVFQLQKRGIIRALDAPANAPANEISSCTFGIAMATMYVKRTKVVRRHNVSPSLLLDGADATWSFSQLLSRRVVMDTKFTVESLWLNSWSGSGDSFANVSSELKDFCVWRIWAISLMDGNICRGYVTAK